MQRLLTRIRRARPVIAVAAALWLTAPASARVVQNGDTVAAIYQRAQAKEQVARATEPPTVKDLRIAATAYERIFRTYPTNGYADNALWQAAGLLSLAYQVGGDESDREAAERWLEFLQQEYPSSPLTKKVPVELQALAHRAPGTTPPNTATPSSAPA